MEIATVYGDLSDHKNGDRLLPFEIELFTLADDEDPESEKIPLDLVGKSFNMAVADEYDKINWTFSSTVTDNENHSLLTVDLDAGIVRSVLVPRFRIPKGIKKFEMQMTENDTEDVTVWAGFWKIKDDVTP